MKYEYQVRTIIIPNDAQHNRNLEERLNRLGEEGWKLEDIRGSVLDEIATYQCIFIRPKE